jgi:UDPglucose 6-dehydrogenase
MVNISVYGLGRVGLVTAVCFARKGYTVFGFDQNNQLIKQIRHREAPFHEPHLADYIKETVGNGRLHLNEENSEAEFIFITVGTPSTQDGGIDLTQVKRVAEKIGRAQSTVKRIIVVKSTVIPGTARMLADTIFNKIPNNAARVCSNPEFLREGNAIQDTELPDRIVIGGDDPAAMHKLEELYKDFCGQKMPPVVQTTFENAEMIKYASNAFLATKISFINCLAGLAAKTQNADIKSIATGIGLDPRIGDKFLNAGLGWGGSCFPKDLDALLAYSKKVGHDALVLKATKDTNKRQWKTAVTYAKAALGSVKNKKISVLGLAFKPNTDDMREAVSIRIINELVKLGANVAVFDPAAMNTARKILGKKVTYANDPQECVKGAYCCIIATEWDEFRRLEPSFFLTHMAKPIVVDGRRIYDPKEYRDARIKFFAIGLGPPHKAQSRAMRLLV